MLSKTSFDLKDQTHLIPKKIMYTYLKKKNCKTNSFLALVRIEKIIISIFYMNLFWFNRRIMMRLYKGWVKYRLVLILNTTLLKNQDTVLQNLKNFKSNV